MQKTVLWFQLKRYEVMQDGQISPNAVATSGYVPIEVPKHFCSDLEDINKVTDRLIKAITTSLDGD